LASQAANSSKTEATPTGLASVIFFARSRASQSWAKLGAINNKIGNIVRFP
jgi:hypothetical protein